MTYKDAIKTLPQYFLPHHPLSRLMRFLTHSNNKAWKNFFIQQIVRRYQVNLEEAAEQDIDKYTCFNDFFTRALKPGIRPIAAQTDVIASPADGSVSQCGKISSGQIIQAKGKTYTVTNLLGGHEHLATTFDSGQFATIYLSPKDYHRLHMPVTGSLREMIHIPGRLFSVNGTTARNVPDLFARNERVVAVFDTEWGPMALVLVGAIFVASIETVWHGEVTPPQSSTIRNWNYSHKAPKLEKGAEMGRFNMGSTIIVLFAKNKMRWSETMKADQPVKLGEAIGHKL